MRAHAPFPVLLATAALLIASLLLPASLLARNDKHQATKQPRAAHHASPVHPRSRVHKAAKHQKHVGLPRTGRRDAQWKADEAASNRVHAWVKGQKSSPIEGVSVPVAGQIEADTAKPVSAVSTIRGSNPTVMAKPQLPPIEDLAAEPEILPTLYTKRGRLIVPPALKGSHEILVRQNQMANDEGLDRVRDDEDLERLRKGGMLVPLPVNSTLHTDERLPTNRRYCRPWTALFLDTLARQHYARFQTALQVNSAVRTVEFQQRLIHTNGNAAPAEGDTASPHLTGQAIDIAKRGLTMAEIAWLRGYLLPLVQQGKVDVEEEFQQSCFHISVYKKYMPPADRRVIATTHREGMGALGMSLR